MRRRRPVRRDPAAPPWDLAALHDLLAARAGTPGPTDPASPADPDAVAGWDGGGRPGGTSVAPGRGPPAAGPRGPDRRAGPSLPPEVRDRLGVERSGSHQAEAIDLARAGRSVVVATGTASGKSLCYQVPIAEAVGRRRSGRGTALLLFPTKALAQDQLRALTASTSRAWWPPPTTATPRPRSAPGSARTPTCVLTNPEMLHSGILPHHGRWATFLSRLRYVVVDELHVLRGIFGTHVAHLLRRLRRLCAHYGADPTFVFSSATIGEPGRLASALCGLRRRPRSPTTARPGASAWSRSGTRRSLDEVDRRAGCRPTARPPAWWPTWSTRATARSPSAGAAGHRARRRRRPPAPARRPRRRRVGPTAAATWPPSGGRSRPSCSAAGCAASSPPPRSSWASTSAGSTPACSTASPARSPRCGSRPGGPGATASTSLAVLVAGDDQLDQWLMAHPDEVFTRPPEPAVVNPANPFVARLPHLRLRRLRAAAHPRRRALLAARSSTTASATSSLDDRLRSADADAAGGTRGRCGPAAGWPATGSGCAAAAAARSASRTRRRHARRHRRRGPGLPSSSTPARSTCTRAVPSGSPTSTSTTGLARRRARTTATSTPRPAPTTDIRIARRATSTARGRARPRCRLGLGRGALAGHRLPAAGRRSAARCSATEELDLPPVDLRHPGASGTPSTPDAARGRRHRPAAGCRARCTPPSTPPSACCRCSRSATAGTWAACPPLLQADTGRPTIVIYDGYPGGAGIAELGFDAADRHLARHARGHRGRAPATTAARRACSRPSAATATSRSTRPAPSALLGVLASEP